MLAHETHGSLHQRVQHGLFLGHSKSHREGPLERPVLPLESWSPNIAPLSRIYRYSFSSHALTDMCAFQASKQQSQQTRVSLSIEHLTRGFDTYRRLGIYNCYAKIITTLF